MKILLVFGGAAASVDAGNFPATVLVDSEEIVAGNAVEDLSKVVFFSLDRANGEGTGLLLLSALEADWGGKKLDLRGSLLPKTLGVPVESPALVVFAGRKSNFGGCLLSKGL